MKLTKDDFDIVPKLPEERHNGICWLYIHHLQSGFNEKYYQELIDQILKNQEDAEKYQVYRDVIDKAGFAGLSALVRHWNEAHEIVERLKKRIEEIKVKPLTKQEEIDFKTNEYHAWMKRELQEILEINA